ncbi:MAG TPA: RagB/SusD family nutrient uptake outer membrane protein, partial [Anseongella sp.]|nr:RagB/SusD family nutrient uptake outer membrane protein [Anseongella sp.]
MAGCNDDFLAEKRDLSGYNEEVYMDEDMAQAYVGYIYHLFQPGDGAATFVQNMNGNRGQFNENFTRTSEELAGQTNWNREWDGININQGHALNYFGERMGSSIQNNVWTRLRQINLFLAEIDKHGLTEEQTAPLKGQMLFWRAYQYFDLLRLYGGVPLVLEPQDPIVEEGDTRNEIPRSTSSETLAQILADLDAAASLLPGKWPADDWGRITSGAALALKGRVLLTWASPLFNRSDDAARWQAAYEANLAARNELEANGFGLYANGDFEGGEAWENMWFDGVDNPEAVLVWVYNDVESDQTQRNNGWEAAARSEELLGEAAISPTRQMLDAFPMKDGKQPGDASSAYTYDPGKFYKDRDPRFYKTFVYNGALWPYGGNSQFRQWTYYWHSEEDAENPDESTEDDPNDSGIYLRKATDPDASNASGNFDYSSTNFMEMRFAEVILNLAESAIGIGNLGEGLELIKAIRERAGLENLDGAYGLSA